MVRKMLSMLTAAAFVLTLGVSVRAADEVKKPGDRASNPELLKKFDKNGDGKLDASEMQAAKEARGTGGKPAAGAPGKPGERKPGEGRPMLTPEKMQELIKKFDKDGDGKLNDAEKGAAREEFMKLNGGRPGAGKPGEGPRAAEFMKRFDKNGDGKLDDAERAAAREAFQGAGGKPGERKPGAPGKPGEKK